MAIYNQWHVEELTLDLDSNTQGAIPIIYGRQGDKDGILCNIELTQQGVPVQQSWFANKRVYFEARGNGVSVRKQADEIVDGVVKVVLPEAVFTQIGLVKDNFLRVEDATTGNTIISGTSSFQVYVRRGNLDPNASAYYLEEIEHIVNDVDEWVIVLKRLLEQYANEGQAQFDIWFKSVREVLYGIDPGGNILAELIEARTDESGFNFPNLKTRLDNFERTTNAHFAQNTSKSLSESLNVRCPFGTSLKPAVGDGVTDDTEAIQAIINYAIANGLAVYFPKGDYLLTATVFISSPIYIFGLGQTGLNTLIGGASVKLIIKHAGIGVACQSDMLHFGGSIFEDFAIVCHPDYYETLGTNGMLLDKYNHVSFVRVAFQDFRKGIGQKFESSEFAGQYSSLTDCKFGQNLIGSNVRSYNGLHFINCMFDGNSNGSWIDRYEKGVPTGSIGINHISGDSMKVSVSRFQGFEIGVFTNASGDVIDNCRFEMCLTAAHFGPNSRKCTFGIGSGNNNYLLLGKNGLPDTGRVGRVIKNEGTENTIHEFSVNSCAPIEDIGTNTNRLDSVKINMVVDRINSTSSIPIFIDKKFKTYRIRDIKITCENLRSVDMTYGNRWRISTSSAYFELYNASYNDLEIINIPDDANAQSEKLYVLKFTKFGTATELKNVAISLRIETY